MQTIAVEDPFQGRIAVIGPDTGSRIQGHGDRSIREGLLVGIVQIEFNGTSCWRPEAEFGSAIFQIGTELGFVRVVITLGVEVIQHTGDLYLGKGEGFAILIQGNGDQLLLDQRLGLFGSDAILELERIPVFQLRQLDRINGSTADQRIMGHAVRLGDIGITIFSGP